RPEFLNRLDEVVLFRRLSRDDMAAIVDIQLARLQGLLEDRQIDLTVTLAARGWLGEAGYDPVYGARPLKRVIQRHLQNPLASQILAGAIADGGAVTVDLAAGALTINGASPAVPPRPAPEAPTAGAATVH
ncbi:MAG: ATP-dependent chaperone ClpB, partial [Pseudomonadota bacterium]|nr:ATP-dependent chaperone ClpB [Pseudomonadota bacterium]